MSAAARASAGPGKNHDNDVHPSSSCYYRPSSSSADPPTPAMLHRWRLDAGNANSDGADARCDGRGGGNR